MLEVIQRHLENIYRIEAPDVRLFLINDQQLLDISDNLQIRENDEWVLVQESGDSVDIAVYLSDVCISELGQSKDIASAAHSQIQNLCTAIEGVSHFMMLVDRAMRNQQIKMLDLEIQGEIDKFICAQLHHPERSEEWLSRLFRRCELRDNLGQGERDRYRTAGQLAYSYCQYLSELPHVTSRLNSLRKNWRRSGEARLDQFRKLAA